MSKKERINSTINILTALIIAILTALFSMLGYAVINHNILNNDKIILVSFIVGIILLLASLFIFALFLIKNLKKLGDMK